MSSYDNLRWADTLTPRARRIPDEEWERHREEITNLHSAMTLDQLMEHMENKHGFKPNRRQYVFRFDKWGLHKYSKVTQPSWPERTIAEVPQHPYQLSISEKRLRSEQSLVSVNMDTGQRTQPTKRHKLIDAPRISSLTMSQNLPGGLLAGHSPGNHEMLPPGIPSILAAGSSAAERIRTRSLDTTSEEQIQPHRPVEDPFTNYDVVEPENLAGSTIESPLIPYKPDWTVDNPRTVTRAELSCNSTIVSTVSENLEGDDMSVRSWCSSMGQSAFPGTWDSVEDLTEAVRHIDINRPIGTYTTDDIKHMGQAQELLYCFWLGDFTASLANIILEWSLNYESSGSTELVRLAYKLGSLQDSWAGYKSVAYVLAFTESELLDSLGPVDLFNTAVSLAQDFDTLKLKGPHLDLAREYMETGDLLSSLPLNDRSLDLLTYRNMVATLRGESSFFPGCEKPQSVPEIELEKRMLELRPGPFEISEGKMRNQCLRSCLQWCLSVLTRVPSIDVVLMSKTLTLMMLLIKRWQLDVRASSWASQAKTLMGFSPVALLEHTCRTIIWYSFEVRHSKKALVCWKNSARHLLQLKDSDIAKTFLRQFVSNRLYITELTNPDEWCKSQQTREELMHFLGSSPESMLDRFNQLIQIQSPSVSPSPELKAMQRLQRRVRKMLSGRPDGDVDVPSSVLPNSSDNNVSIFAMSILSAGMSSLRLSQDSRSVRSLRRTLSTARKSIKSIPHRISSEIQTRRSSLEKLEE